MKRNIYRCIYDSRTIIDNRMEFTEINTFFRWDYDFVKE